MSNAHVPKLGMIDRSGTRSHMQEYDHSVSLELERAYQCGQTTCNISTSAGEYQVNVKQFFQCSAHDTKLKRNVRRCSAEVDLVNGENAPWARSSQPYSYKPPLRPRWCGRRATAQSAESLPIPVIAGRRVPGRRKLNDIPCSARNSGLTGFDIDRLRSPKLAERLDHMGLDSCSAAAASSDGTPLWSPFGTLPGAGPIPMMGAPTSLFEAKKLSIGEAELQKLADNELEKVLRQRSVLRMCQAIRSQDGSSSSTLVHRLQAALVPAMQELVDGTYLSYWTHDRRERAKHEEDRPEDTPSGFKVISAEVVHNMHVQDEYKRMKMSLLQNRKPAQLFHRPRTNKFGAGLETNCNEWMLFHGTSEAAARSICKGNFKMLNQDGAKTNLCGTGFYFTESATKADEYSSPDVPGGDRVFILCRVLGGSVHYTEEKNPDREQLQALLQNGSCNSILNDREKSRKTYKEFVVARPEQVFPECIVRYQREF